MKTLFLFVLAFAGLSSFAQDVSKERRIEFKYDALNRLTNAIYSNGYWETYAYDAVGKLTNFVDSTGRRRTFAYNAVGNLTNHQDFGPVQVTILSNSILHIWNELGIPFDLKHDAIPIENITTKAYSSNANLVSIYEISGKGTNRAVRARTPPGQAGKAVISIVASDGFVSRTNHIEVSIE